MNRMLEAVVKPLMDQLEEVRIVKHRLLNDKKVRVVITAIDPDRDDSEDRCEVVTHQDMAGRDEKMRKAIVAALTLMESNLTGDIRGYDPEFKPQPAE